MTGPRGSIHRAAWPTPEELIVADEGEAEARIFLDAQALLGEIRRQKSLNGWKTKTPVHVTIQAPREVVERLRSSEQDVRGAVSAGPFDYMDGQELQVSVAAAEGSRSSTD